MKICVLNPNLLPFRLSLEKTGPSEPVNLIVRLSGGSSAGDLRQTHFVYEPFDGVLGLKGAAVW